MTNTDLYTTLEQSRAISGVMEGVEADAAWCKCYADDTWKLIQIDSYGGFMLLGDEAVINSYALWSAQDKVTEFVPAFRLDKLLLALPEWLTEYKPECRWYVNRIKLLNPEIDNEWTLADKIETLKWRTQGKGQEAIKAAVQLLTLLDTEGLLEEKKK